MAFSNRLRAFANVGADGSAVLQITPPPAIMRARAGSVLQRVVASVPLPPIANVLNDSFSRVVANGWGIPDVGPAWAILAGIAGDWATNGTVGQMLVGGGVHHAIASPVGVTDADELITLTAIGGAVAVVTTLTGPRVILRAVDVNNYYFLGVAFTAPNVTSIALGKRVGGVETIIATSAVLAIPPPINFRFRIVGPALAGTAWAVGALEPAAQVVANDLDITAAGSIGDGRGTLGTNLYSFDNLIATALAAQSPIWDAYLGPVLPQNLVDSSVTPASRWVPTLATGQTAYRGEELNVVARAAPVGQQVELQATFVTED